VLRAELLWCCVVPATPGALGLDLSFVRFIFLMEPLADASLEQQVRQAAMPAPARMCMLRV
jgi:hypothetical protein